MKLAPPGWRDERFVVGLRSMRVIDFFGDWIWSPKFGRLSAASGKAKLAAVFAPFFYLGGGSGALELRL
jgi:hypothetical protein